MTKSQLTKLYQNNAPQISETIQPNLQKAVDNNLKGKCEPEINPHLIFTQKQSRFHQLYTANFLRPDLISVEETNNFQAFAQYAEELIVFNLPVIYECYKEFSPFSENEHYAENAMKATVSHELWHLYSYFLPDHSDKINSLYWLVKPHIIKRQRQFQASELEIQEFVEEIIFQENEFWAYMFSEACLNRIPLLHEYYQKLFGVNTKQIHQNLEKLEIIYE